MMRRATQEDDDVDDDDNKVYTLILSLCLSCLLSC